MDYSLQGVLELPPLNRDLQIDYTAPSFTTPERVQFLLPDDRHRRSLDRGGYSAASFLPRATLAWAYRLRVQQRFCTVRPLMPLAADGIHRIGREALINAFQHSNGSTIELEFQFKEEVFQVRVCDDGRGIERAERIGAKLTFIQRDLRGTEVKLVLPAAVAYQDRVDMS